MQIAGYVHLKVTEVSHRKQIIRKSYEFDIEKWHAQIIHLQEGLHLFHIQEFDIIL